MKISQSFIKSYRNAKCKYEVKQKYINGVSLSFNPDNITARDKGVLFETLLIGNNAKGVSLEFPKKKDGTPYAEELAIIDLSQFAKEQLKLNNIKFEQLDVEVKYKDLRGRFDGIGAIGNERAIIDVKWTGGNPGSSFGEYQWADSSRFDYTQAKHYTAIHYLVTGELLPFYLLVFGSYGGNWFKIFKIDVSLDAIQQHLIEVKELKEQLKKEVWKSTQDAGVCNRCELKHLCDKVATKTLIEEVYL